MAPRRFPPPRSVEDIGGCFAVKASNGRPLIFICYGEGAGRRSLATLLTRDVARRIAAGIAKLPELLRRNDTSQFRCPLSGVKRTLVGGAAMSAFDPKRTFGPEDCCYAILTVGPHFVDRKSLLYRSHP